MSWTSPKTWVTGEVISAGAFNTHVRDQLFQTLPAKAQAAGDIFYALAANTPARLAVGSNSDWLRVASDLPSWATVGYQLKRLTGDIAYTAGSSNITDWTFVIAANDVWEVTLVLFITPVSDGGAGNGLVPITVPSGCVGHITSKAWEDTGLEFVASNYFTTSFANAFLIPNGVGGNRPVMAVFQIVLKNSTTAGNVTFAISGGTGNSGTLKAGSYLEAVKVA